LRELQQILGAVLAAAVWKPKRFGQGKEELSRAVNSPSREQALVFGFGLFVHVSSANA
jgi:hypothetical protein